jgi:hypothetical protein
LRLSRSMSSLSTISTARASSGSSSMTGAYTAKKGPSATPQSTGFMPKTSRMPRWGCLRSTCPASGPPPRALQAQLENPPRPPRANPPRPPRAIRWQRSPTRLSLVSASDLQVGPKMRSKSSDRTVFHLIHLIQKVRNAHGRPRPSAISENDLKNDYISFCLSKKPTKVSLWFLQSGWYGASQVRWSGSWAEWSKIVRRECWDSSLTWWTCRQMLVV